MSFMAIIYGIIIASIGEVVLFYLALAILLGATLYFVFNARRHMKVALLFIMMVLSACSATSPLSSAKGDLSDLLASLRSVTTADLDAATARAVAGGDTIGAACYPVLKKYLGMGSQGEDKIAGVFDAFEKARLARKSIPQGIPDDLRLGCAALVQDERDFVLRMAAIAGAGAVSGGIVPPLIVRPAIPLMRP